MKNPMLELQAGARALLLAFALLSLIACSSTTQRRDPTGETFPSVRGETLDGTPRSLPADLAGEPAILLVGYDRDAQFDLDRWILGLVQLETPVRVIEVPTIEGMLPGMAAGFIDDGMRTGIPREDWASVITVYQEGADRIVAFTGNKDGRSGRVLLLDHAGRVVWFADRGYSAGQVKRLDATVRGLVGGP